MLSKEWQDLIEQTYGLNNLQKLLIKVNQLREIKTIYPIQEDVLKVFTFVNPDEIKVVIIGQDPYHGVDQANGLAFSVRKNQKIPPSLKNIFKELKADINQDKLDGNLENWAKQGVFLINSILTVEEKNPLSHKSIGWELFTDSVIRRLGNGKGRVFILMGKHAKEKEHLIDSNKNLVLFTPHPSPLSAYRGFFGSKIFSKTNDYLLSKGKSIIEWGK